MSKKTEPKIIDPTAPGGMSMAALRLELATEHGMPMAQTRGLKFPQLIDAVVQGRLDQEQEEELMEVLAFTGEPDDEVYVGTDENGEDVYAGPDTERNMVAHRDVPEEVDDLEDLLAEFDGESVSVIEEAVHDVKAGLFVGMPGTKDYIFNGHRGAGPSGAERWMACTASLAASRAFLETLTPNQQKQFAEGSEAARQGTTAHAAAEAEARVVLGELTPEEAEATLLELAIMPETEGEAYDDTMGEYVSEYVALVKSYVDEGREVLVEHMVTATIPLLTATDGETDLYDITGSLDLAVIPTPEEPVLRVGDLKYGEGIDVDVEANPQIRIYALGLLAELVERHDGLPEWLTDVEYLIAQPRLGGMKVWTETVDELLDWQDEVLSKALTEALGGARAGAAFVPGEVQCQWCPARGSCPALAEQRTEQAAELFDVIVQAEYEDGPGSFPETELLSDEHIGSLYSQIKGLTDILSDLKEEAQRRLYRGQQVPGFVLVNYSPPRKWTEEAGDELDPGNHEHGILPEAVAESLWSRKLVTPTAAEKLLGEDYELIKALVDKPDKRPVIAPEGDRRSLWEGRAPEDMFDDEGAE